MRKVLEFVCGGNFARSPTAALIASNYIREIGLDGDYRVESSGTIVDAIKKNETPMAKRIEWIERAIERGGILKVAEIYAFHDAMRERDNETIDQYSRKVQDRLHNIESQYRTEALAKFGIEGLVKDEPVQTVAGDDRIAVLSMTQQDNEKVVKIYSDAGFVCVKNGWYWTYGCGEGGHSVIIDSLLHYAKRPDDQSLNGKFGKSKESYFRMTKRLLEVVPIAVDRLVGK